MIIPIERRRRAKRRSFCANLDCLAPLEPPYNVFTFSLECEPAHVFERAFCVDCMGKILGAKQGQLNFRVVKHETS